MVNRLPSNPDVLDNRTGRHVQRQKMELRWIIDFVVILRLLGGSFLAGKQIQVRSGVSALLDVGQYRIS